MPRRVVRLLALSRAPAAATFHLRTRTPPDERCATGSSPVRCLAPRPWTGAVLNPPGLGWSRATAGRNAGGRAYAEASRGTGLRTRPTRDWLPAPAPVLRGPTAWKADRAPWDQAAAGAAPRSISRRLRRRPSCRARMTRSSHGVWGAGIDFFFAGQRHERPSLPGTGREGASGPAPTVRWIPCRNPQA